jgi:hypothetical protein
MTAPGGSGPDGSFNRSAGDAALRGAFLVGVAVVIGLLLLWKGLDGGGSTTSTSGTTKPAGVTTTKAGGTTIAPGQTTLAPGQTTTTASVPGSTRPPSQVKVLVANGGSVKGAAASVTAKIGPKGFVPLPPANAAPTQASNVFYRDTFLEDAKSVAAVIAAPADTLAAMPATLPIVGAGTTPNDANVIVIIGLDGKIKP